MQTQLLPVTVRLRYEVVTSSGIEHTTPEQSYAAASTQNGKQAASSHIWDIGPSHLRAQLSAAAAAAPSAAVRPAACAQPQPAAATLGGAAQRRCGAEPAAGPERAATRQCRLAQWKAPPRPQPPTVWRRAPRAGAAASAATPAALPPAVAAAALAAAPHLQPGGRPAAAPAAPPAAASAAAAAALRSATATAPAAAAVGLQPAGRDRRRQARFYMSINVTAQRTASGARCAFVSANMF